MKKNVSGIGFLILLLMSCALLTAEVGVKAGGLLSFADENSVVYNASNRLGFRGGAFWSLGVGPISVYSGIDLARKGAKYYSAAERATLLVDLDYLIVPLLLNIHFVGTPLDIYAGPYGGVLVRSTKLSSESAWTYIDNRINRWDYGMEAGIRCRFMQFFFVELQFDYGMAKVVYDPEDSGGRIHKNRTLALLFGLRL